MKNPSFNLETLVRPVLGNDTKLRGAMPEMLDDGDDKHEKIQGPSAKVDGRHSSYKVDHGHRRNGEDMYYGNLNESEDDLIDRIDNPETDEIDEFNGGISLGLESHPASEEEMTEDAWDDILDSTDEYFNETTNIDKLETDIQANFDKKSVKKTEQAQISKDNRYIRRVAAYGKHSVKPRSKSYSHETIRKISNVNE